MYDNFSSLNTGIVGGGLMGYWHAWYVRRLGARLKAVVDTDLRVAESLAKRLSIPDVFTDTESMFRSGYFDIVHVCTPLSSHNQLVLDAINAGAHVIVEKPLTETADETRAILATADKEKVLVCPVHQFCFQQGVLDAMHAIEELGDVISIKVNICSAGGEGYSGPTLDKIIADIIPHPLSVLQTLWPEQQLNASDWHVLHPDDGELTVNGMSGKAGVTMYISMHSRPTRCEMDIMCSKGHVHLDFFHGYSLTERGEVTRLQKLAQPFKYSARTFFTSALNLSGRILHREPAYPGLHQLLRQFYGAVLNKKQGPVPINTIQNVADVRDQLMKKFI